LRSSEERREQAARHAARLEDALSSSTARAQRAEELTLDRAQQGGRLREAERRLVFFEERVRQLEGDLTAASAREAELKRELAMFRMRDEHMDHVNHSFRHDLRDEGARWDARGLSPRPPPRSSPVEPTSSRMHAEPLSPVRQPLGPEHLRRLSRSWQLRKDAMPVRRDFTAPPDTRRQRTVRLDAQSGALPDRTAAAGRYSDRGGLVSYDAQGRAV